MPDTDENLQNSSMKPFGAPCGRSGVTGMTKKAATLEMPLHNRRLPGPSLPLTIPKLGFL